MTDHTLSADCPCGPTVEFVPPTPTQRQMRSWLLANGHPVGRRGFLPAEAVKTYRLAHGLPTGD